MLKCPGTSLHPSFVPRALTATLRLGQHCCCQRKNQLFCLSITGVFSMMLIKTVFSIAVGGTARI